MKVSGASVFAGILVVVFLFFCEQIFSGREQPISLAQVEAVVQTQILENNNAAPFSEQRGPDIHPDDIIRKCAPSVAPETMRLIAMHESRWKPYAIGINRAPPLVRQPANKEEAIYTAQYYIERGLNLDLGFMQINSQHVQGRGWSVAGLFDVCANVRAAETILIECYQRAKAVHSDDQRALHAALSCYNTGDLSKGLTNGYVAKVLR